MDQNRGVPKLRRPTTARPATQRPVRPAQAQMPHVLTEDEMERERREAARLARLMFVRVFLQQTLMEYEMHGKGDMRD